MHIRSTAALAAILLVLLACREKAGLPETETTGTPQAMSQTSDTARQTTTAASGGNLSDMTPADKEFIAMAGMAGLAEVQMGNLGLQKASSSEVRAFAQRMVTDHSKANSELAHFATFKGVSLPAELDGDHKAAVDHLTSLSGTAFDKAFMEHMVSDHNKAVTDFENASTSASDAELKAWAAKTLPTLQDHLNAARELKGKV